MTASGNVQTVVAKPAAPRLLDQVVQKALDHFGRPEPGKRYEGWVRRFVLFHGKRHPREFGKEAIERFLRHLAQTETDPLASVEQAHEALVFLYQTVLGLEPGPLTLPEPPRLLDRVRHALRVRHYSPRTEACYVEWAERFIRFHGKRHPNTMGGAEIEMFLTDLAVKGHVSASTQNQAFNALLFLYQQVLGMELPRLDAVRARRPKRLPTVLSVAEVRQLLDAVRGGDGVFHLMAGLLYGAGLRREECCRLRVQDVDVGRHQIMVRHGKGSPQISWDWRRCVRAGEGGFGDAKVSGWERGQASRLLNVTEAWPFGPVARKNGVGGYCQRGKRSAT